MNKFLMFKFRGYLFGVDLESTEFNIDNKITGTELYLKESDIDKLIDGLTRLKATKMNNWIKASEKLPVQGDLIAFAGKGFDKPEVVYYSAVYHSFESDHDIDKIYWIKIDLPELPED